MTWQRAVGQKIRREKESSSSFSLIHLVHPKQQFNRTESLEKFTHSTDEVSTTSVKTMSCRCCAKQATEFGYISSAFLGQGSYEGESTPERVILLPLPTSEALCC